MILTPAQRRDYSVAVKNGTTANALANIRVAQHGGDCTVMRLWRSWLN